MATTGSDASAFHDFEQAGWQRAAAAYGEAFGSVTMQTIPPMLAEVRAGPGVRLLDVATGPGYVAEAAAAAGATVVGIDFSTAMLEIARRRCPDIPFHEGDAEALPYPDAAFTAVTMNFGLLHLGRPDVALAEAHRVLGPGGRCAFTVWADPEQSTGFRIVLRAVEAHGRTDVALPPGPPFFRFSDPEECIRTLTAAGFSDCRAFRLPLVWRIASAGALYDAYTEGAVRTAALLKAQTADATKAIQDAIRTEAEVYRRGHVIELPMAAILASGRRS